MNNEQLHRDIGKLEGKLDATAAKVDRIETKLDDVLARQNRRIGAAAVLSALASFVAAWIVK